MPLYLWEGKNPHGAIQKGEMEAASKALVLLQLKKQKIIPLRIRTKPKDLFEYFSLFPGKVKEKELVVFARQFATLIEAGLPLVQSLEIVSSQQKNKAFRKILENIKKDIEGGASFNQALKKYPKVFSEFSTGLISAGETGGILDTVLNRLASHLEKSAKLKRKVKSALFYPLTILSVALVVVAVMLIFIIPTFQKMFAGFGQTLPAFTQLIINLSNLLRKYVLLVVGILVASGLAFRRFYASRKGKLIVDRLILKFPIFGPLLNKVAIAKFARTLESLVKSGIPILEGLDISAKTAGNAAVESTILKTKDSIREGKSLTEPLAESDLFPPMVTQMIAVGESSGALDTMLGKIADFYEDEVDVGVETLTSLIEPFLMIFLGGLIGGLVVSMYLPIFKMAGALG